jgi:Fic family protein
MTDWDADSAQLQSNLRQLRSRIGQDAVQRVVLTIDTARMWHRTMMQGLTPPKPEYIGRFRGELGLEAVGNRIGNHLGARSTRVAAALTSFEGTLQSAVKLLDELIEPEQVPGLDEINAVIDVCAWVHSEWVRIHPFVNGNGRTARLWVNAIAMRYGLPAFVRVRPRPDGGYAKAANAAMTGNWQATVPLFRRMYDDAVRDS